jgi:carboxyl-terminal processing protease
MAPRPAPFSPGIVLILTILAGGWFFQRGIVEGQDRDRTPSQIFDEVIDHISQRYVDPVERERLFEFALEGILRELGDPNTALLNPQTFENFRIQTEGDYGGIGLEIVERDGYVTVVGPIPGTPGARAGIRAGDRIVEVEGESIVGWTSQDAVQVLRGPAGEPVTLKIERPMVESLMEFTLERARIRLRSVPFALLLDGGVGYIPLGVFNEGATREVRAAADSLREAGATRFILDLRGNPGGILEQGIGVADLFLPRGLLVSETRGQAREQNQRLSSASPDRYEGLPMVVLVDRGSASASEIVAGALQDHDRAVVVGSTTFGKGSVQTLFPLADGSVLKLTTARWHTPAGRSIERMGGMGEGEAEAEEEAQLPALSVDGRFVFPADTAGRPVVSSMGGRPLYGGGGIVPDRMVLPDTLSTREQEAVRELFREGGRFGTGVFSYAVGYLQRQGGGDVQRFPVSEGELSALLAHLRERGFETSDEVWRGAARFVAGELEAEIALQGWGEEGQFLRRMPADEVLQEALTLLRSGATPQALMNGTAVGRP